ncbi:MAG: hypothetical protein LUD15_13980 [Bacteroides sp.]|nr:hypothetical protein [Bacteroides sp.]
MLVISNEEIGAASDIITLYQQLLLEKTLPGLLRDFSTISAPGVTTPLDTVD